MPVRGNETTAGQQPMLVGSCIPQTLGQYTGETQPHLQGSIYTCKLQNFFYFLLQVTVKLKVD